MTSRRESRDGRRSGIFDANNAAGADSTDCRSDTVRKKTGKAA